MLPLLVIGGVAAYGLIKGGKAAVDRSDASAVNSDARSMVHEATVLVNKQRTETNDVLEDYGSRKLRAFNMHISEFIAAFGRLKNVEELHTPELEKLQIGDFSSASLKDLKRDYQLLMESGLGLGAGLSGGAALAFGAYNGTMMLATASTGTAISGLSGAAATNATLAWLGGGSLAAGGGGIAMGTMVLGGIVAAPALAIFGHIMGSKAEAALADARSNHEKARTSLKDAQRLVQQLQAIARVTTLANNTFSKVSQYLRRSVHALNDVIKEHGEDYSTFSQESKETVFRAVKFAQLIKAMIDTPILDENGSLVLSTEKRMHDFGAIAEGREPTQDE